MDKVVQIDGWLLKHEMFLSHNEKYYRQQQINSLKKVKYPYWQKCGVTGMLTYASGEVTW